MDDTSDEVKTVIHLRNEGNNHYKERRYDKASEMYSQAIDLCSHTGEGDVTRELLYCNRSAAWIGMNQWEAALGDARAALSLNPQYTRAHQSLARIYFEIKDNEAFTEELREMYNVIRDETEKKVFVDHIMDSFKGQPEVISNAIWKLNVDQQTWTYISVKLQEDKLFDVMANFLRRDEVHEDDHPLSHIKVNSQDLIKLHKGSYDQTTKIELTIWLINRSAKKHDLIDLDLKEFRSNEEYFIGLAERPSKTTVEYLKNLGNYYEKKKENHLAVEAYSKAISMSETESNDAVDIAKLYSHRATVYMEMNQVDEASADAEKAIKIDPSLVKEYKRLLRIYKTTNERSKLAHISVLYYKNIGDDSLKERRDVVEQLILNRPKSKELVTCLHLLNMEKDVWSYTLRILYKLKKVRYVILKLVSEKSLLDEAHPLRNKDIAKSVNLGENIEDADAGIDEIIIWMLRHGADINTIDTVHFKQRPVSCVLYRALTEGKLVDLLRYCLRNGLETDEAGYPVSDDHFHQVLFCITKHRLHTSAGLITLEQVIQVYIEKYIEQHRERHIPNDFHQSKEFAWSMRYNIDVIELNVERITKKQQTRGGAKDEVDTPQDPCMTCYKSFVAANRTPDKNRAYELLCGILNESNHDTGSHTKWEKRCLQRLCDFMKESPEIPPQVLGLTKPIYIKLLEVVYENENDWYLTYKLIRDFSMQSVHDNEDQSYQYKTFITSIKLPSVLMKANFSKKTAELKDNVVRTFLMAGISAIQPFKLKVGSKKKALLLTPLQTAAHYKDGSYAIALIEFGANPNDFRFTDNSTPVHSALKCAFENGQTDLLKYFLQLYEKNPNEYTYLNPAITDGNGDTLLHQCAKYRSDKNLHYYNILEFIETLEIEPGVLNKNGETADVSEKFIKDPQMEQIVEVKSPRGLKKSGTDDVCTNDANRSEASSAVNTQSKPNQTTKQKTDELPQDNTQEKRKRLQELVNKMERSSNTLLVTVYSDSDDEKKKITVVDSKIKEYENCSETNTIEADSFANLPWEIECSFEVLKLLAYNDQCSHQFKQSVLNTILQIASGDRTQSEVMISADDTVSNLYMNRLNDSLCLIWQVAVAFSKRRSELKSSDRKTRMYADIIRLWAISSCDPEHIDSICKKVARSCRRSRQSVVKIILGNAQRNTEKESLIGKVVSRKHAVPNLYMEVKGMDSLTNTFTWTPAASWEEYEYHIMKCYAITPELVRHILQIDGNLDVDFPFNVTETEYSFIHMTPRSPSPLLVLGRSGTGKTTCCLYRLIDKFKEYWEAEPVEPIERRQNFLCDHGDTSSDSEGDNDSNYETYSNYETNSNSGRDHYDNIHQVVITKNPELVRQIQRNAERLLRGLMPTKKYLPFKTTTVHIQDIADEAYPIIMTYRQLLNILDYNMEEPFFKRDGKGLIIDTVTDDSALLSDSSDEEEQEVTIRKPRKRNETRVEITYELFERKLWPRLKTKTTRDSSKDFHPSLVWMEIVSFIKGSFKSLYSEHGYLSLDEYIELGRKFAPHFTADREEVYKIFTKYRQICVNVQGKIRYFDESDIVHSVYRRLLKYRPNWVIHQIFADEVQDFTQAQLTMLTRLCQNPNDTFFTGDTAQSIMRGVSFRFTDLKTLFHAINEVARTDRECSIKVPKITYTLTQNYRSHTGIIRLANGVIELLKHFFPNSFEYFKSGVGTDAVWEDTALFHGPKPIALDMASFTDLYNMLQDNKQDQSVIEFGAHQAILVVNEDAKNRLPAVLRETCLVFTIYQSKGQEFDDILLYNFFQDSAAKEEWRVVSQYVNTLGEENRQRNREQKSTDVSSLREMDLTALDPSDRAHPLDFDQDKHKILNSELKNLYTAITRARVNVWIYDEDTTARKPMFEYFKALHLVVQDKDTEDGGVKGKKSSKRDWRHRGKDLYRRKLFKDAALCFENGGDQDWKMRALACMYISKAKASKSKREQRDFYLDAGIKYLECSPSQTDYEAAALCMKKAMELEVAGKILRRIDKLEDAADAFLSCKQLDQAILCYEKSEYYDQVIQLQCEKGKYEEAYACWKTYERAEVSLETKDEERKKFLDAHRPRGRYTKENIAIRLAKKRMNVNFESACSVLEDIGWGITKITGWLCRNECSSLAIKLLERKGKYFEAAEKYIEVFDYNSAIHCLTRLHDKTAKLKMAQCHLDILRGMYVNILKAETEENITKSTSKAASISTNQYENHLTNAKRLFKELLDHRSLGECFLIESSLNPKTRIDSLIAALGLYNKSESDIGIFLVSHQLISLKPKRLKIVDHLGAMRSLGNVMIAVKRTTPLAYKQIQEFYGVKAETIPPNAKIRALASNENVVQIASQIKIIEENLLLKANDVVIFLLELYTRHVDRTSLCKLNKKVLDCEPGCKFFHGNRSIEDWKKHMNNIKRLMLIHGMMIEARQKNADFNKLILEDKDIGRFINMNCHELVYQEFFLGQFPYAHNIETTRSVFVELWRGGDARKIPISEIMQDRNIQSCDMPSMMCWFYIFLAIGEFRNAEVSCRTFNQFIQAVDSKQNGKAMKINYFLESLRMHYSVRDIPTAMGWCNRYLSNVAFKTETFRANNISSIIPIFELQFIRGILLHLRLEPNADKMTNCVSFFPESYLRLLRVFDTLCYSKRLEHYYEFLDVYDYDPRNQWEHSLTTVKNQLRSMCEVFFGIRSSGFNMLDEAMKSKDANLIDRVIIFGLTALVNLNLTISNYIPENSKRGIEMKLSLEEVIMRDFIRISDPKHPYQLKELCPNFAPFLTSLTKTSGLSEIVDNLADLMKEYDTPLIEYSWEAIWGNRPMWKHGEVTSHNRMANKFISFRHDQVSESYKMYKMQREASIGNEDEEPEIALALPDITKPDDMDEEETDDVFVNEGGCEICDKKFDVSVEDGKQEEYDSSANRLSERQKHKRSPEHAQKMAIYKKFEKEIKPICDELIQYTNTMMKELQDIDDPVIENDVKEFCEKVKSYNHAVEEEEYRKRWKGAFTKLLSEGTKLSNTSYELCERMKKELDEISLMNSSQTMGQKQTGDDDRRLDDITDGRKV